MSEHFEEQLEHAAKLCDARSFDEASELLRWVLEHDRGNGMAWNLLARSEFELARYEAALDAAEQASKCEPRSAFSHVVAAFALLGLGRREEALHHAREAVGIDPFDWRALGTLARLLTRDRSELPEARELVARMVRLAPDAPDAHLTAGSVAAATGDREGARRAFRRALELDPTSSAAQHGLAALRLRRRVNDPAELAEAAAGFARAVHADPETTRSRTALEALLRLFLSKAAYLLLVDAYLIGRLSATSDGTLARLLPPVLLLIPVLYAWRFCRRLTTSLRGRLVRIVLGEGGPLRFAATCEALSVLGIVAGASAPQSLRPGLATTAAVLALLGRVVIYTQLEHASRVARGASPRPAIRPGFVRVLAALVGLVVVALLVAAARDGGGAAALLIALVLAVGAGGAVRSTRRRRTG